jgi:hypothetical protein
MLGNKESEWKLTYELDRNFIEWIAKRMESNKGKYEPYNWQKEMDVDKLKQSLARHFVSVMKWEHEDDGEEHWHLYAMCCNIMMILYQLDNNQ